MFPCAEARTAIFRAFEPQGDGRSRVTVNQRFYPRDKLKKILTRDRVAEVLKCSCDHCGQQRRDLKLIDPPSKYIDSILDAAISLFALLIFIRAPPFVAGFLVEQVYDQSICNVPGVFLKVNIGDQYWSNFHKRRKEESEALEDEFRNHLFHFAIPTFTSRQYHAFHEQTMLPFVEQRQLGRIDEDGRLVNEGAYGTVYAFKIWPAYNALPVSTLHILPKIAIPYILMTSSVRIPKESNGSLGSSWTSQLDYLVSKKKTWKWRTDSVILILSKSSRFISMARSIT